MNSSGARARPQSRNSGGRRSPTRLREHFEDGSTMLRMSQNRTQRHRNATTEIVDKDGLLASERLRLVEASRDLLLEDAERAKAALIVNAVTQTPNATRVPSRDEVPPAVWASRLAQLESEAAQRANEMAELIIAREEDQDRRQGIEASQRALADRTARLQEATEEAVLRAEDATRRAEVAERDNHELRRALAQLRAECDALKRQVQGREADVWEREEGTRRRLRQLEDTILSRETDLARAQQKVERLQMDARTKQDNTDALQKRTAELEAQIKSAAELAEKHKGRMSSLAIKVRAAEDRQKAAEDKAARVAALEKDLQHTQEAQTKDHDRAIHLAKDLAIKTKIAHDIESRAETAEGEKRRLADLLKQERATNEAAIARLRMDNATMRARLDDLELEKRERRREREKREKERRREYSVWDYSPDYDARGRRSRTAWDADERRADANDRARRSTRRRDTFDDGSPGTPARDDVLGPLDGPEAGDDNVTRMIKLNNAELRAALRGGGSAVRDRSSSRRNSQLDEESLSC